ncbi:MAG: Lipid IVA 3-deoxy-D-manno-octulosonic acid transferase (EC [often with (EC also] [uncultured Aureispira sp.]|uniref:3-deoxy-D-manno-octulosonic acid transferase n=1 Tax=uncultured Aureispira sp. TaxID=1331704 RepID=A0A6S6UCW1_9BACT|nr:MAG: Lipid IVA 3-deoxy-D-manno-octulosonic acid transferase (EC [often with (EC also] [uncultured Aureispira sp.]
MPTFSTLMSVFIYTAAIFFYTLFIHLAALLGNQKAKKWKQGRQDIFKKLNQAFANNSAPVLWVHCASLGEFEQGRPVIEALKSKTKNLKVLLTFFSPSGYEIRQNYAHADWVFYLPVDSKKNARRFISTVKPQQVIFVKYEFWYYYLTTLQAQKIPTYLISAVFRSNQAFFKWYGGLFRKMLCCFEAIFVQNKTSLALIQQLNYSAVYLAGDTRLDRVLQVKNQAQKFPILEDFYTNAYTIVAGSTWLPDEKILADLLKAFPDHKLVVAPHQIDEKHLQEIETLFKFTNCIRYSKITNTTALAAVSVLLIDNIGMLNSIYAYANVAYIGGGFGTGIHNILEAAVFEIPVFFGPNHHKFQEAKDLITEGVGFEVNNSQDIINQIQSVQKTEKASIIQKKASLYFQKHGGASAVIVAHLEVKKQ